MDGYGGNKIQNLYIIYSKYFLILDNGLEHLWRREKLDSPEFARHDVSFSKDQQYTGSIMT